MLLEKKNLDISAFFAHDGRVLRTRAPHAGVVGPTYKKCWTFVLR
jgi:hypothetical protein